MVAASEASYHLHSLITQSRQPSIADPVPHRHTHLTPKPEHAALQLRAHSQSGVTTGLAPALLTQTVPHSPEDPPRTHALHTQTVTHPDAADSELTEALRELQLEQAHQQQPPVAVQSNLVAGPLHAQCMAKPHAQTAAQSCCRTQEPAPALHSQPILQDAQLRPQPGKEHSHAQTASDQHQQKPADGQQQSQGLLPVAKQPAFAEDRAQLGSLRRGWPAGKPAFTVLGVQARATGLGSLTEAQVTVLLHLTSSANNSCALGGTLAELTTALASAWLSVSLKALLRWRDFACSGMT